jgi:Zn-dependent protease with chaperone function
MLKIQLIFILLIINISVFGQAHSDYIPLKLNEAGAANLKWAVSRDLSKKYPKKEKGEIDKSLLYKTAELDIKEHIKRGEILSNDTLSRYLNSIADRLASARSSLKNSYHVYLYKNAIPNAYTYPDGTILVTTGLISRMTSESQMAFVLGHELGHFIKKHNDQAFEKEAILKKDFKLASPGSENTLEVLMHYSREFEMEADALGIELMNAAGFDVKESLKAIKHLMPYDTASEYYAIDLRKEFNTVDFNVDSMLAHFKDHSSNIKSEDEKYSTHPDMDKRYIAIKELLANMQGLNTVSVINDSVNYEQVRYTARMENILAAFSETNYSASLYLSLRYLQTDRSNKFLKLMIARNLLWLANYKDNNALNQALSDQNDMYAGHFKIVEKFIKDLSSNDFKKLAYSYIKHNYNKDDKNEELSFYMAYISDFYLGSGVSRFYFSQYLKDYPNGKYAGFTENKLQ